MLSLWRRGALADVYYAHALNTASTTPRGYRAMWSFTSAVQRDEMAIACTGHAHLVTCERYERSGEEAFTAKRIPGDPRNPRSVPLRFVLNPQP